MKIQYVANLFSSARPSYLVAVLLLAPMSGSSAPVAEHSGILPMMAPSINPPYVERPEQPGMRLKNSVFATPAAAPSVEWTYHRTADGQHPNGDEQQIMWLMNQARQNPTAEGVWLAKAPEFAVARNYFKVDTLLLQAEFASYASKPPAAFDMRLYTAAKAHSDDLIARDAQDHNGQFDRIDAAGFQWQSCRGNVFSYATDALNAHGGWNIDWGFGSGGMQDGRGHRMAIMAVDGNYTNVGIAAVPESNTNTRVGPLVATGNYCQAQENGVDHFNRFIVGTVWQDLNSNSRYDPGEGLPNILITPNQGRYFAITAASGGYAIPIMTPGAYQITFSGSGITITRSAQVDSQSVLLDLQPEPYNLLTVKKAGAGSGTVTGTNIDCGGDCTESYPSGTLITLTATPATGSTFTGWSGECSGTSTCTVTMNADKTVTATFTAAGVLPGDVNGDGSVNALDVVAVINTVLGIQTLATADVNNDGVVNALDVVFVINKVLGI